MMHAIKKLAGQAVLVCLTGLFLVEAAQAALPIQHWRQPSGAQVYLVESHAVPMVDIQVDFDAGGRRDPAGQAGLANLTAAMTSRGVLAAQGEPALDEHQLGEAWADLGASFSGGASADRMSFSLRSLSDPELLQKAVALAARQMGEPAYPPQAWARDRERFTAAIREANTRPGTVAQKAWTALVFGSHPYGAEVTEASLAAITPALMRNGQFRLMQPCRAKVSIVGDVSRAQADSLVGLLLSRLNSSSAYGAGCAPLPPVADVEPLADAVLREIPFASAQAHVLIGQPGYKRSDPDHFALLVGNHILGGGGFTSRLMQEVREKRGLTYGVSSAFSPGLHAGAFAIGLQTRPDQAAQALAVAREVLTRFVAEGPSAEELRAAKDNLVGGFPLLIDSNRKLLDNVANIAWNGLPLDYLATWRARVEAVTQAQVREAMARKLQPGRMVTVVLGAQPGAGSATPAAASPGAAR